MARTLIASDNFNRAGPGLGSDWANLSTARGDVVINSSTKTTGQFGVVANDHAAARWVGAGTFSNDQYASIKVQSLTSFAGANERVGVIVRAGAGVDGARNYYLATADADSGSSTHSIRLSKWVSGTFTSLHQANGTLAENDRLELEAIGTSIRVCINGTPIGGAFTVTDSDLTTGKPGVAAAGNASCFGDDWEGGDASLSSAPVLSSPTTTSITATTATIGCTTDTASGTLYAVVTTSATQPSIAQIKAGQTDTGAAAVYANNQAVSSTGAKTASATGLTASTVYYHHWVHNASSLDSNRLSSSSFTTSAGGGATAVTLTGPSSGTVGVASTNFTAGANGTITGTVIVTPSDSGGGGTFTPTTVSISSGTPTATFTYTAGSAGVKSITVTNNGSLSNPSAISYTASAASGGTLTIDGFKQWTGTPHVSVTVPFVKVCRISTGAVTLELTSQAVNSSSNMVITNATLSAGVAYMVFGFNADGSSSFKKRVTAA